MAQKKDNDQALPPQQQRERVSGISAAAIEGAKEGERSSDPDDNAARMARPAPGMTEQPAPAPSSTNQYTGITGQTSEDQEDEDQEWRRAGGGEPGGGGDAGAGGDAGKTAQP